MEAQRFDTSGFAPSDQFEAWTGWFDRVFDVEPAHPPLSGFAAASEVWTFGGFALSRVQAPRVRVTRSRTLINRNPIDPWVITLGRDTTTAVTAGRQTFLAPPRCPF